MFDILISRLIRFSYVQILPILILFAKLSHVVNTTQYDPTLLNFPDTWVANKLVARSTIAKFA